MKKRQISILAVFVLLFAAGGILYYTYAVQEDANGLTKKDIAEAQEALYTYIEADNAGEYDTCIAGLSDYYKYEYYNNDTERILQSYTYESNVVFRDFEAEYNADTASTHLGYYVNGLTERKEYLADKKAIYFSCDFWIEVKENGDWKIISTGY